MGKNYKSKKPKGENGGDSFLQIDPERIRFQHSKIRPFFSGCGRSVLDTLESIRQGHLRPEDLPPIQVIVGPDENDDKGPWYFSLNNRRLWVLKRCREEGLLQNNVIRVRVREAKSGNELERYTLKNCAVEARFMREQAPPTSNSSGSTQHVVRELQITKNLEEMVNSMNQYQGDDEGDNHTLYTSSSSLGNSKSIKLENKTSRESFDDNDSSNHNDNGGDDEVETKTFCNNPFCLVDDSSSSSSDG